MELTPWFPGCIKPARVGVYERDYGGETVFSRWDGRFWHYGHFRAETAMAERRRSRSPELPWRGLPADPNPPAEALRRIATTLQTESR